MQRPLTYVAFVLWYPGIIYHCDLSEINPEPKVFREVEIKGIKQEDYQTTQVTSPCFIVFACFPRFLWTACLLAQTTPLLFLCTLILLFIRVSVVISHLLFAYS